jgi:hypothetical protein
MSNNEVRRGEQGPARIPDYEKWGVDILIDRTGATQEEIEEAITAVGYDRQKVEEYLLNKRIF